MIHKNIEYELESSKNEENHILPFREILGNSPNGVTITDSKARIKWINNSFTKITGYSLEEVLDKNPRILQSGIHHEEFFEEMWRQILDNGKWSGEIWNKNKEGIIYSEWLEISTIQCDFTQEHYYVGIFKDLSQKKKIDRRMSDLQQKDLLTGVYNRNYFLDKLEANLNECKKTREEFAIVVLSIEGLREVNASLGHSTGDKVLIELAERIDHLSGGNDSLSRIGGDEFAFLYRSSEDKKIISTIEEMLDEVDEPFIIDNVLLHIYINIGISRFPYDGNDMEKVLKNAHIAMENAKKLGGKRISCYSSEMSSEVEEKFHIANFLFDAVENKELYLNYQPIIDIKGKKLAGAEALLRWEHPILGRVRPDKFIPIAESTGQIISIGKWVIEEVCRQINQWRNKGFKSIPIAINISVRQLEQGDFFNSVINTLKKYKVEPKNIELEITESVSFGEVDTIIKNLQKLKKIGFRISMDDFGTGFSSLGQLSLYELDKLKIDKVFVDDLVEDRKNNNIVNSIIAMAKSLNLSVVAEGIENSEQLEQLKNLGCEQGQGYLFSKPLAAKDMDSILTRDQ